MGFGQFFRRVGTVAAAPVTLPARAAKARVEKIVMNKVIALLIRHALTFAGGGAMLASDNDIEALAGALATIGGIVWSIVEKRRQAAPTT